MVKEISLCLDKLKEEFSLVFYHQAMKGLPLPYEKEKRTPGKSEIYAIIGKNIDEKIKTLRSYLEANKIHRLLNSSSKTIEKNFNEKLSIL
jgi:hypothetical protein